MSTYHKEPIVLPFDVYDRLAASSKKYGGIGAGCYLDTTGCPFCAHGHAAKEVRREVGLDGKEIVYPVFGDSPLSGTGDSGVLGCAGVSVLENDCAVRRINERKGLHNCDARVSFEEWCAELKVVRGEKPAPKTITTTVTTKSGSVYTFTEEDGCLTLTANNRPNPNMPALVGQHNISIVTPFPPRAGERLVVYLAKTFESGEGFVVDHFVTSLVEKVEVTEG